jgi:hypothetical protein
VPEERRKGMLDKEVESKTGYVHVPAVYVVRIVIEQLSSQRQDNADRADGSDWARSRPLTCC